jgi:transcriptional regulator with XRE-family HTH domain
MIMSWQKRIKELQESMGITSDEMAQLLGISPRTLGDFTRPDGRQPSEPIQKLIEFLEKDHGISKYDNKKASNTILIIINSGFYEKHNDIVEIIDRMTKDDATSVKDYHFIYAGSYQNVSSAISLIQTHRNIKPHYFFLDDKEAKESHADVSYFSSVASLLIEGGIRRNVSHIVFAADFNTFSTLLYSYNDASINPERETIGHEVNFTYISDNGDEQLSKMVKVINPKSINTRHKGKVISKKESSYGFISLIKDNEKSIKNDGIFFSYNSIRKNDNKPDIKMEDLSIGDTVSFNLGINNKGICAIDMVLIEAYKSNDKESESVKLISSAISDCMDETGWALLSNVGSRLSVINKNYKEIIKSDNYEDIGSICRTLKDIFEYSTDGNGKYKAACVRLKER